MIVWLRGRRLEILTHDGIQPTVFSLFLANIISRRRPVELAVDAGAGGGILALALGQMGVRKIIAIEQSERACELLKENARVNGLLDKIEVVCCDIREYNALHNVDLVVSNPPTVPEVGTAPTYISGAGQDGTAFLRALLEMSSTWLGIGGELQTVVSSLVDEKLFFSLCQSHGLSADPLASLVVPFRPFYYRSYTPELLADLTASGRIEVENYGEMRHLNELITVYACVVRKARE